MPVTGTERKCELLDEVQNSIVLSIPRNLPSELEKKGLAYNQPSDFKITGSPASRTRHSTDYRGWKPSALICSSVTSP